MHKKCPDPGGKIEADIIAARRNKKNAIEAMASEFCPIWWTRGFLL